MFRIVIIESVPEWDDCLEHVNKSEYVIELRAAAYRAYKEEVFDHIELMQNNTSESVVCKVTQAKHHTALTFSDPNVMYSSTFDVLIYDET